MVGYILYILTDQMIFFGWPRDCSGLTCKECIMDDTISRNQILQIEEISKNYIIAAFSLDGILMDANDKFFNTFGYKREEAIGIHHSKFWDKELVAAGKSRKLWNQVANSGTQTLEIKRLTKDGTCLIINAIYTQIKDQNGDISQVLVSGEDITERKKEEVYRLGQIDAINKSQAVIEFDIDGTIITANENFLSTMGYSLEEIQGRNHTLFCDEQFVASDEYKQFWDILKKGKYHSGQFKRLNKEGKIVWIRATYNPIYDIDGNIVRIVKFAHDITLDQEKSLYHQSQIEAINKSQAVIEFEMDGTIVTANDIFLSALGYTLDEVVGKHHSMFCDPAYVQSKEYEEFLQKLQNGIYDSGKYLRIGKNGKRVWIRATYTPILNIENKPVKILKYAQDITELEAVKIDTLTGLFNRSKLALDLEQASRNHLAIINTNEFDIINDFYGYIAGETLIVKLADMLQEQLDDRFVLYRLYNDKLVIVNHSLTQDEFQQIIAHTMTKIHDIPVDVKVNRLNLTTTCGISHEAPCDSIRCAKIAHNFAREQKKGMVVYSRDLNIEEQFEHKISWSRKINSAIEDDRIIVHYQAIHNNHTGKNDKYEVLVRTLDEDKTIIYPNKFLTVAKTSKQYLKITKAVIEKSFETFSNLPYEFSINFTMEDIWDQGLQDFLFDHIEKYRIGNRLVIEIVESERVEDYEVMMDFIQRLKSHGCKLAIDDFGSGYSNYEYLLKLDADFVKIDGSIVSKVMENNYSVEIIKSIVSFCKKMGIKTVAEYVFNEDILKKVTELGVDFSQGFYTGKPQEHIL